jgi:hypothetical protein
VAAPLPGSLQLAADTAAWLSNDTSPWALNVADQGALQGLCHDVFGMARDAFAVSTHKTDQSHWRKWAEVCARLGTTPWRTDVASNAGLDSLGFRREVMLKAIALVVMYSEMAPRSRTDPAPKPESAVNKLLAVNRAHRSNGYPQVSLDYVKLVARGMLRRFARAHGALALSVHRKKPLTNDLIAGMLATPNGAARGSLRVDRSEHFWVAMFAVHETAAETGGRKGDFARALSPAEAAAELSSADEREGAAELARLREMLPRVDADRGHMLTFASLVWKVGGREVLAPTPAQFTTLQPGDGVWLIHGTAKNDPFAAFFTATPSFLPFSPTASRCACRALAALEGKAQVDARRRATTPLFGPSLGAEFSHAQIDAAFDLLLSCGAGVADGELGNYSFHSYRAFLASALLVAKVPREQIMRMLRWRSEDSLIVYARLSDADWAGYVEASRGATVDASVATRFSHDLSGTLQLLRERASDSEMAADRA